MPDVSADLRTYTFHIRPGITFADGEAVDSAAFRFGIERVLDPATQSPQGGMGGWFGGLEGAQDFVDGKSPHVAGIATPDPLTMSFTLVRPDRTFTNILATPFSSAVPRQAVERWGSDYGHHVVASGQFTLQSWVPGQSMVLARNSGYFDPGTAAKVDEIEFTFGLDPQAALERGKSGEIDVVGDSLTPELWPTVAADPTYQPFLRHGTQAAVNFLFMNTQMAPFDDPLVRQAVSYAVDRAAIVRVINGRGEVADQVLPPSTPGYDPSVEPTPYDPAMARQLLARAGYPEGIRAEFVTSSFPPGPDVAEALKQQMAAAGIALDVKALSTDEYFGTLLTRGKAAIGYAGWVQDYPDPSNFLDVLFNSAYARDGAFNVSEYRNADVDALLNEAQGLPLQQAIPLYRQAQKTILADNAWVPLFYPVQYVWANPDVSGFKIGAVWAFDYAHWSR